MYELAKAVDRVRAAVEAARSLKFPFTLTARCENFLLGIEDLKDTIKRLQAYQEAGADVLYAPCITSREHIKAVVGAVDQPVNFLMGTQPERYSLAELSEMGVRRVSVGSALSTVALGAILRGAREMKDQGTFNYTKESPGSARSASCSRRAGGHQVKLPLRTAGGAGDNTNDTFSCLAANVSQPAGNLRAGGGGRVPTL